VFREASALQGDISSFAQQGRQSSRRPWFGPTRFDIPVRVVLKLTLEQRQSCIGILYSGLRENGERDLVDAATRRLRLLVLVLPLLPTALGLKDDDDAGI
jgi:hypothetical protein